MSTQNELIEIQTYLHDLGARWAVAHEPWVKDIIASVLNRRTHIMTGGTL